MILFFIFLYFFTFSIHHVKTQNFSFAQLTDQHIGYNDKMPGYYQTAITYINDKIQEDNIKFAILTGDLTDHSQYEFFIKGKEITEMLEIPYFPILGNHDVKTNRTESHTIGDKHFLEMFGEKIENQKIGKVTDYTGKNAVIAPETKSEQYMQNYMFEYDKMVFLFLDWSNRRSGLPSFNDFEGGTFPWFKERLKELSDRIDEVEQIFMVQHNPFLCPFHYPCEEWKDEEVKIMRQTIEYYNIPWNKIWGDLAGHMHLFSFFKNAFPGLENKYLEYQAGATRYMASFTVIKVRMWRISEIIEYCPYCPPNLQKRVIKLE